MNIHRKPRIGKMMGMWFCKGNNRSCFDTTPEGAYWFWISLRGQRKAWPN